MNDKRITFVQYVKKYLMKKKVLCFEMKMGALKYVLESRLMTKEGPFSLLITEFME